MNIWQEIKASFRQGSSLTKLVFINAGLFILIKILDMIGVLASQPGLASSVVSYLAVPASINVLLQRPWTLLTYMFLHEGFIHILFNMMWLWWFGKIFLAYLDQRKLVSLYLLGGLAGAAMYIGVFNLFPAFATSVNISSALGASAAVMAIVIATAVYLPDMELYLLFLGKIKLKYLAIFTFLITSVFDFSVNTGGKIAHIGGALMGFAYGYSLKNGKDIGAWLNRIIDFLVTIFRPGRRMKVTYKKPRTDYEYNNIKAEKQKAIDHILDKISKGGYDSLTREEKEILFSESQKKR